MSREKKPYSIEDLDRCIVLCFCDILGKKWTYPILFKLEPDREYSFTEILSLGKRRINRTLLSVILRDLIMLDILEKNRKKYRLTNRGIKIKNLLTSLKAVILEDREKYLEKWREECEIIKFFGK